MAIEWQRPELWPLLFAVPAVAALAWALRRRAAGASRAYGAAVAGAAADPLGAALRWGAATALLVLAAIEPRWGEEDVVVERRGLDLVFVLDVSRSMLARDVEPDRLQRARRDIHSVLPTLVAGDRVALVAFAGEARLVVPRTHDLDAFRQLLATVDTDTARRGGSDLAAALRAAAAAVEAGQERTSFVLLLTDGEDLAGAGLVAARELRERAILVHALGYGSTQGAKIALSGAQGETFLTARGGDEVVSTLDADGLRAIASATGGEFLRADTVPLPLLELKEKRLDPLARRAYEAGSERQRRSRFQWLLLPALLVLLAELWRSGGRSG
ncbi:MAG: VWA domain-containing protein [Planctomycetes bacterium]|nr:VWA domain-containing protein [Planctomycetota bacterium]